MTSWHADSALLEAYADGRADSVLAISLEAHLVRCERCRLQLGSSADAAALDGMWNGIVAELNAPRPRLIERLLARAGVPSYIARLIAATPSLRASWLAAVAIALGFAVGAAHAGREGMLLFLILAPLLPVAGVAAAYGPGMDPTYEIGLVAPMRSFRLVLIRSVAVLASTTALAGVATLLLPRFGWTVVAWLAPSLALTALSLALATVLAPAIAAGTVAGAWVALTTLWVATSADRFAAFRAPMQAACLIMTIAGAAVISLRSQTFETRRTR